MAAEERERPMWQEGDQADTAHWWDDPTGHRPFWYFQK